MNADELEVDARERLDRWIHESQQLLEGAIPGIMEDRQRQQGRVEAAERTYDHLRVEADDLRRELRGLDSAVRTLKGELVEMSRAAAVLADHLHQALVPLTTINQKVPPREAPPPPPVEMEPAPAPAPVPAVSRSLAKTVALVAAGAIGALVLALAAVLVVPMRPAPPKPAPPPELERGAPSEPAPARAPSGPAPAVPRKPAPKPAALPKPAVRLKPPVSPESVVPIAHNEIRNFRAVDVSGQELRITVDYAYAGDYGASEIFMHAVALERDEWTSRVPGTGFPYASIGVGGGTVTIDISRQPDTPPATSTVVKVCMVSIKKRAAFMCQTFAYTKTWES